MTTLDVALRDVVSAEVRKAARRPLRHGTLQARTGDITGQATEDGSVTPMPVLILGDVLVEAGDRIVMAQFGSDWVVMGPLTPRYPSELFWTYDFAGETVTGGYTDMPGLPATASRTLIKRGDTTAVLGDVDMSCFYPTGTTTECAIGFSLTSNTTGTVYGPTRIARLQTAADGRRLSFGGCGRLTSVPADSYLVRLQWQRVTGTGVVTTNSADTYSFTVKEFAPPP